MTESIEQQIQLYGTLSTIFLIAAIVFLVLAIALFVLLRIPQTFNELRGRTAEKAIAEMAANSEDSGGLVSSSLRKSKSGSILNRKRSYTESLSDELPPEVSGSQTVYQEAAASMETSQINAADEGANETSVMNDQGENATTVMTDPGENATTVMKTTAPAASGEEGTVVLNASRLSSGEGTMVLNPALLNNANSRFVVERSIMLIHTDEEI